MDGFYLKRLGEIHGEMIGVLRWDAGGYVHHFNTIELPWNFNKRNISCVPNGEYWVKIEQHKRFGYTIRLQNVPGRSGILIHFGTKKEHTRGCILIENKLQWKIFQTICKQYATDNTPFTLTIQMDKI